MSVADTPPLDPLASAFVLRAAQAWERNGLPLTAFASACVTWGLQVATAEATPAEVAEGLQRMADAILEAAPRSPKGLH